MTTSTHVVERKLPTKTKKEVWQKASALRGHPEDIWRKDADNKPMNWDEYQNPKCNNGWQIIYITPLDEGGADEPENMQAVSLKS